MSFESKLTVCRYNPSTSDDTHVSGMKEHGVSRIGIEASDGHWRISFYQEPGIVRETFYMPEEDAKRFKEILDETFLTKTVG
jgi:hypothetical protein